MKILLIGNHTCGNRGDAAILRGLIEEIRSQNPKVEFTVTSRYPISSSFLLGRDIVPDPFYRWRKQLAKGFSDKVKERLARQLVPALMMLAIRSGWRWPVRLLPKSLCREIDGLSRFDAVIQVGGSFFVDLYGSGQYEYPFAAILAGRPLYLIGHSMGPFMGGFQRKLAETLIRHSANVALREPVSREIIEKSKIPMQRVTEGADTAWAVPPTKPDSTSLRWLQERAVQRPVVAITVRELAPFDRRLGTTQQAYEEAFARLVDRLVEHGYDVVAASTCTGIESYHRDDRMNALRVGRRVKHGKHFHVVMDELNDIELGELFAHCELVIGTRLHSAIISMNFGTPAIAINYEHKSEGIMRQLGLSMLSQPVHALLDGSLTEHVMAMLPTLSELRVVVAKSVTRERERVSAMVAHCLASI